MGDYPMLEMTGTLELVVMRKQFKDAEGTSAEDKKFLAAIDAELKKRQEHQMNGRMERTS